MVKSFKKAIACLLAVLMVVCAMPFTALAAVGDYHPDVELQFGTLYDSNSGDWENFGTAGTGVSYDLCSLYDSKVTATTKKNTDGSITVTDLRITKEDQQKLYDVLYDPEDPESELIEAEDDIVYGDGSYITISVLCTNLEKLQLFQAAIAYTGVEPVGVYKYTSNRKTVYAVDTVSKMKSTSGASWIVNGEKPIEAFSAIGINPTAWGTAADDVSYVNYKDGYMFASSISNNGKPQSVASVEAPGDTPFTNPETGDMDGYAYTNTLICATFAFKITDASNMTFSVFDEQNTKHQDGNYSGGYVLVNTLEDGNQNINYTTYATEGTVAGGAGAGKMTMFGMNVNTGEGIGEEQECTHTNTTVVNKKDATCTEAGYTGDTKCDSCGDTIATGKTITALGHDMQEVANSAVAATCETAGKEADTKCSRCEEATTGDRIDPIGHKYGEFAHVADTNTHAKVCANDASHVVTENCEFASSVKTEPTYTVMGWTTYTCKTCDNTYDAQDIPVKTCEHAKTTTVGAKEATCTEAGYTGDVICDACSTTVTEGKTIEALGHDMQVVPGTAVTATCKADGKEADMACSRGDKTETGKTISKSTVAHTSQTVNGKSATCTEPGLTAGAICSVCETVLVEQTEIKALGHTIVSANNAVAATCTTDGKESDTKCSVCLETLTTGKTIKATGHSFTNYVSDNNATVNKNGTKTAACDNGCGTSDTIEDEDSALGVNVTISDANDSFGNVTPAYGTTNYAFGETVTLTASALEDCEFVGWEVGGKLVSTDKTYTFEATVDVTVTPVFRPIDAEKISVIFYDKYSNVIASYMDVTPADFQAAMATKIPTAPVYAGYTFAGYSLNDEAIKSLAESTTIWAYYNEDTTKGFTVETTADATIVVDAKRGTKESDQRYVDVMFDTQATVTAPGASAWKVDDAIVGYGESYSFFVGSDIMIEPVFEAVEATPAVAMVKAYKISADSHKIMFLASMNIPAGYKLVDHGFVYGKNMITSDLVLENVGNKGTLANAGDVKKTSAGTNTVEQFGISYGITKQTGKACAAAYLTFVKDGVITTIHSDAVAYDYDQGKTIPVDEGEDD